MLENYTLKAYPAVQVLKDKMEKSPARKVLMSGSGPTVFAVFDDVISSFFCINCCSGCI